jgi:hypothetical protein
VVRSESWEKERIPLTTRQAIKRPVGSLPPSKPVHVDLIGLSSNALFTKNRGIVTILNDD